MVDYADAGVDIELGDDASKVLYEAAKQTWENREGRLGELIVPVDDFSGVRAIDVSGLPAGTLMNMGFDGVGTKMELAERLGDHTTIAYDLFAMVCDDAIVRGAEPVLIGSLLDVNTLGRGNNNYLEQVKQLARGYIAAAKAANVAIVNGEIAELGNRVGGFGQFNYNWGAAVVWFAQKDRMFTGHEIVEGDALVGLREKGFRSNGLSLVRKILEKEHGEEWHNKTLPNGGNIGKAVLFPSTIYSAAVGAMTGGYEGNPRAEVHGFAHITGGGLPGKLGRVLGPSGLGANVNDPFSPALLMLACQRLGNVTDREAYKTWNMGQGGVVITPEPEKIIGIAEEYEIEAKQIGTVTGKDSRIHIDNRGYRRASEGSLDF